MADIKSIQVDGVDYAVKDESARNSIGDLSTLTTEAKDDLVAAVNELYGKKGPIQRIESLDETNMKNLRDLTTGSYVLYGYFRPYAGASNYLPFDNLLVNVYHVDEGSHLFEFSTANSEVNFIEILVDDTAEGGHTYSRTAINMLELNGLVSKLGNLNELATTEKGSVVAAINEVAASGGSGSSVQPDLAQNDSTQPDYVKNRTHWEEGSGGTIEWDGDTEGREVIPDGNVGYYKISNIAPSKDEIIGGTVSLNLDGSVSDLPISETDIVNDSDVIYRVNGSGVYSDMILFYGIMTEYEGFTPGLYAFYGEDTEGYVYAKKLTYHSVIHKLDPKFLPEGGVGWEEKNHTVIEWDGGTEGRDTFNGMYKVSDLTPTYEDLVGATVEASTGESATITADVISLEPGVISIFDGVLAVLNFAEQEREDYGIPDNVTTGIYFLLDDVYTSKLIYSSVTVHQLDEKFLPKLPAIADLTAAPTAEDFNNLLAALRTAGYLASE